MWPWIGGYERQDVVARQTASPVTFGNITLAMIIAGVAFVVFIGIAVDGYSSAVEGSLHSLYVYSR
jgi:hypothetical protein